MRGFVQQNGCPEQKCAVFPIVFDDLVKDKLDKKMMLFRKHLFRVAKSSIGVTVFNVLLERSWIYTVS